MNFTLTSGQETIITIILILLVLVVIALVSLRFSKLLFSRKRYAKHKVYSIKIPRERNRDDRDDSQQEIREEIAKGEAIFSAIGGLKAERGFQAWLKGRQDHVSFEIVADARKIAFYFACNDHIFRYLEQQIHAQYPAASILEIGRAHV